MQEAKPDDRFQREFLERWASPSLNLRPALGQSGFELPSLSDFHWHRMPGHGQNNWVLSGDSFPNQYDYNLGSDSCNNVLVLDSRTECRGHLLARGSNNIAIILGSQIMHSPVNVHFHSSNHLFFLGRGSTSNTATFEMGTDGTSIMVGEDCMFSAFIDVTTDDHHAIIDLETGAHLNAAADILIEPHVWVGMQCMILKGVHLGFGSIVGARSVVTKHVPRKSAVAGSPATIRRSNVSWTRERQPDAHTINYVRQLEAKFLQEPVLNEAKSPDPVR